MPFVYLLYAWGVVNRIYRRTGREVRLVRNNELAGEINYIGEEFPRKDAPETDNDRSVACGLDPSREDGVGKTVAIIVGSVAGLAVIIVLLSLCQKAMAGNYESINILRMDSPSQFVSF